MAQEQDHSPKKLTRQTLSEMMKGIDICMMTTMQANGQLSSRPMSNNSNVEWDGDTWFFSFKGSSQVKEIGAHANLNLAYSVPQEYLFISIKGRGQIMEDVGKKKELWYDELKRWFPEGPEDESVVLIKVTGEYADYWSKEGDGSVDL